MGTSRKLITMLIILNFLPLRTAKIEGAKFLCKTFASKDKINLFFVVPTLEKRYCEVCKNIELPYLQWRKLYKLYKEKPWVNIILLVNKVKTEINISEEIKKQKIEKIKFRKALTVICKDKEPLLVLCGNIDMARFREIVRILNREEK